MSSYPLHNLPNSDEIWKGIGGHFDSLGQIISEFIDNSITNIISTKPMMRNITISFEEQENSVIVSIEDSGSGIKNLDNAFTLGGIADKQGPLNEHGFGMKHALASANPDNNNWLVCSRTQENIEENVYFKITSPYAINNLLAYKIEDEPWPGKYNGTGTYIKFKCSREMFNTLRTGMPGQANFSTCIKYLIEDLGFIYAGLIERNEASFTVTWRGNGESDSSTIGAINPHWEHTYNPGNGDTDFDLGNGKVHLKYSFGAMKEADYKKYYKKNMSSSGLEIRINGRVLANNLFKEVWHKERHNMYNHLLVIVDIISDKPEHLPPTRTSKNGLRQGDPRLEAIYDWVRRQMPIPPNDITKAAEERDLFDELQNQKNYHIPDPKTVETELDVYKNIGEKVRIDLYVSAMERVWIYEGKKDVSTVKDVYQLMMYWDGAVLDDLHPTTGILIASRHPDSVRKMINYVNEMKDIEGKPYNFQLKTWRDEGIQYPS